MRAYMDDSVVIDTGVIIAVMVTLIYISAAIILSNINIPQYPTGHGRSFPPIAESKGSAPAKRPVSVPSPPAQSTFGSSAAQATTAPAPAPSFVSFTPSAPPTHPSASKPSQIITIPVNLGPALAPIKLSPISVPPLPAIPVPTMPVPVPALPTAPGVVIPGILTVPPLPLDIPAIP